MKIPLGEVLEKSLGYAKIMMDFVIKKRTMSFETVDNMHRCGAISYRSLVEKKKDPRAS